MPRLVNAVGGGDLGVELDLSELSKEITLPDLSYEPEVYPGLRFKFEEEGGTVMLFRTGKYNIAGAKSVEELQRIHRKLVELVECLFERKMEGADERFEVRNLVYLDEYPQELELSRLCVALGVEKTEYDPELYPSIKYTATNHSGVFSIYSNGTVSMAGATNPEEAHESFDKLFGRLEEFTNIDE